MQNLAQTTSQLNTTTQVILKQLQDINIVGTIHTTLPNNYLSGGRSFLQYVTFTYKDKEFYVGFTTSYSSISSYVFTKRGKRIGYGLDTYSLNSYIRKLERLQKIKPNALTAKVMFKEIAEKVKSLKPGSNCVRVPGGFRLNSKIYDINWLLDKTKFSVELTYGGSYVSHEVIAEYDIGNPNFDYLAIVEKSIKKLYDEHKFLKERYEAP